VVLAIRCSNPNGVKLFVDPVSISLPQGRRSRLRGTVTAALHDQESPSDATCGCGQSFSVAGEGGGGSY